MSEQEIYIEAMTRLDPVERQRYLDQVCGGDVPLRRRLDELLNHADQVGDFLEQPAVMVAEPLVDTELPIAEGGQIGPYKLCEQIGDGGMGVVYLAEQTEPIKRRVALKVIKPGMDTKQVIGRFEAERQALALMEHPNIARVIDGGTTESGRPYFVMELVHGVPITTFCDQYTLSIERRLKLFTDVCQAIQHAHHKGIIHRDIKPSNVLVALHEDKPVVKVIDFGIAKATNHEIVQQVTYTRFSRMIGTPAYMSPEQAELRPLGIDTRSDIYSLGAVLYELLAGEPPIAREQIESASYDELRRMIREDEPARPSARVSTLQADLATTVAQERDLAPAKLAQHLRGELDWIVIKSLEKDRTRRYAHANDLAQDVDRYLRNEPITARPTSSIYKIKKFAMRNRLGVAAGASVCVAILLVLGSATVGYLSVQRKNTENEILWQFVSEMYGGSDRSLVTTYSPNRSMRETLDVAAKVLPDRFRGHEQLEIRARRLLANVYRAVQQLPPAKQQLLAALETAEIEYGQHSVEVAHILSELAALIQPLQGRRVGDFYRQLIEAQGYGKRALSIYRKHAIQSEVVADTLYSLAACVRDDPHGQLESEEYLREALSISDSPLAMADVAEHLAHQHVKAKQDEAIDLSARAVEKGQRDYGDHDPKMAMLLWLRGRCLRLRGLPSDSEQALRCYQSAREICQRSELETEPLGYRIALDLAETHLAAHRHSQAHRVLDEVERDCRSYQLTDTLVRCLFLRGWGHLLRDDFVAAEESLRNAYDVGLENKLDPALVIVAYIRFYRGRALFSLGRHQEASLIFLEHFERGKPGANATYPDDMGLFAQAWSALHGGDEKQLPAAKKAIERGLEAALVPSRRRSLPQFYLVRAIAHRQSGELDRAIVCLQQGLEEYDNFSMSRLYLHCRDTPKTRRDLEVTLAQYRMEQNVENLQAAMDVHLQGISKRQTALGRGHLRVALAELRYGMFLNQQGTFEEAKSQLEKTYKQLAEHSEAAPANVQTAAQQLVEVCTALQLPEEKNKWQQMVDQFGTTTDRSP